jgi:hypothetical protein
MNEPTNDPVLAVFKLGTKKDMLDLLDNGHVFMNTASYFTALEDGAGQLDRHEGTSFCKQATGARLDIQTPEGFKPIGNIVGQILMTSDELANANVYCLHARRGSHSNDLLNLDQLRFGDSAVLFKDFNEFLRRLIREAERSGYAIQHNLVTYVDRQSYSGPMGIFRKFSDHAAESEWRIAVMPGLGRPISLHLGNLSDIAMIVATTDRLKLVPKTT